MIIKRKPLSRRTVLRGTGVSLALPFLDIMAPSESYAQTASYTGFIYVPNGWYRRTDQFFPDEAGANYNSKLLLNALDPYRKDFMVISNLTNDGGRANGDGAGDHARAGGSYLSSVKLLKNPGSVRGGMTIDRHIAATSGRSTPLDMLLMGFGGNEGGDNGYNPQNMRISWRDAQTPVRWDSPERMFERLVSNSGGAVINDAAAERRALQKSVLDFVINDELPALQKKLGAKDRENLDSYLSGLRDVERRIDVLNNEVRSCSIVDADDAGSSMSDQIELMFDLMINAFQCDLSRVGVVSMGRELNDSKPNGLGLANGWHTTSHYTNTQKQEDFIKIGHWVTARAEALINKLTDAGLMDKSLISFGAGTGGNFSQSHGDSNLPTLLIGHSNGAVRSGRHLQLSNATPIANLWSAMAYHAGVPVSGDKWGTYGTGRLNLT